MIRPIVGEGFLPRCAPTGRSALISVLQANHMIYVDEVTSFTSVKAYGGVGFVTAVAEVFTVIAVRVILDKSTE